MAEAGAPSIGSLARKARLAPGQGEPPETLAASVVGHRQRWCAALICIGAAIASAVLLHVVTSPMPEMPGFLAMNQGALVVAYGLTTLLFLTQYRHTRSVPLLVLGAGSLYTTLIVLAQLACTPNLLGPGLLLGQGVTTLTWLWSFWHLAPPLFAVPYAFMDGDSRLRDTPADRVWPVMRGGIAATVAAAGLSTLLATRFTSSLPSVTDADGGFWALTTSGVGPFILALTGFALLALCWKTRLRGVLQLWVGVSLFLLILDNVVTDLAAARGTVGWFAGRVEALIAVLVVLGIYLRELDFLYRKADANALSRQHALEEAQSARENLEIALEASGMGDWELDLATDSARRTLRHDRIFGYARLEPHWGRARLLDHVVSEDRPLAEAAFASAMRDGALDLECRIKRADNEAIRWIDIHGRTYFDQAGRAVAMAGCVLDVTDRRLTDERLRQSERLEAIGQLTGGVAHDFNNLLTVILGNLDMITRRPDDAARVERLARIAFTAGRRGTELTEKLLSFSRRQVVHPEIVNLNRLFAEFRTLVQHAVGEAIQVEFDLDAQLDPVRLDQSQFQAAILNLAGNARDAMPSGGRLRLETRNVVLDAAQSADIVDSRAGRYVCVVVSDTGTGMDPATAGRAFEPFFTTKEVGKGTGLGLSQVYGFVRQAGGSCRVRSSPGQGCAVELYLPPSVEHGSGHANPSHIVPLRRATGGEVVLVVEDEDAVREMASESLEGLGYSVRSAPDARVALEILRGPNRIDIMFSDVVMPGGMNGAQLAVEARKIRPELRVLLTSGYTTTATGGSRELPDGVPLLRKPYLREDLAAKLQAVMGH